MKAALIFTSKIFYNKLRARASKTEWVMIGIYSAELLDVNPSVWSHHLNLDNFDVYWDKEKRFNELVRKKEKNIEKKQDLSLFDF